MNTNIQNCNTELLEEQKKQLEYEIAHGENAGHFLVFDIEAGCRKTRTAEQALITAFKNGRKSLFVRQFDNDCRESMDNINRIFGEDISFAYNNEDVTPSMARKMNLEKIPILIITHQKYRVLMMDANKRKSFVAGRTNLVVDEFLVSIHNISLSESDIETYRALFGYDHVIASAFEKTMYIPIDFLKTWNKNDGERRFASLADESPTKEFSNLIKLIRANMSNESFEERKKHVLLGGEVDFNASLLAELKTVKMLCDRLMEYKQLFGNMCLYCDKKLFTTDKRYKYWFLDNNIMLDASGELQIAYSLNQEEFQLQHCEKVLDHGKWKIINIPVTTTTATKERITNFYEVVNREVAKYGDDILVVGKKAEMMFVDVPDTCKGYFGNITGSNQWYDKKHVAIIHTHNLSDTDYILKFLHYSKEKMGEAFDLRARSTGRSHKMIYSFTDKRLEDIRIYWIASEIYQAIKRVNRNMLYETDILIFLNNEKIISLIQEQMKNCNLEIVDYQEFQVEKSRQDEYVEELRKDSYATKFMDLLAETQNGLHPELLDEKNRISKVKARTYLGIKTSGNFSNKVLNKSEVITYCQVRNIELNGQYIKLPKVG